ncbi:MAG TPA: 3-dehydroquinate synthase [Opitutaceae bacterium]|nr:3-dehydroquinate synthase [Opitutaceae bacterium]
MTDALTVRLGDRSYAIRLGADLRTEVRAQVDAWQQAGRRVAVLTDAHLADRQAAALEAMAGAAPRLALPAGEEGKTAETVARVWGFLAAQQLDRTGVLLVVGGGVIGDVGGFAAASYLRGIDYVQVPTTLLAMVDSSVGGKTGVNLAAGKNLVGAFHQPRGVFIATDFLATLPPREFAAGMAEVIKCGLLGDADLFARLERTPVTVASADLPEVIRRCCALKARVVEADERELAAEGGRALLNLGHTFGHAIEQATGYERYRHGEAVAIGLAAAARLSRHLGLIAPADVARVDAVLAAHALPARLAAPVPVAELTAAMGRDKKARSGQPRFVVLRRLGEAATRDGVAAALVETAWREVGAG